MQDAHSILKDFSNARTVVYNNYLKLELGYKEASDEQTYRFYLWSELVNSYFWRCLARIEILFRNRVNNVLIEKIGPDWLSINKQVANKLHFGDKNKVAIEQAVTKLRKKKKSSSNDGIVAELSMGFWVNFLSISFSHERPEKKEKEIGWEYFIQDIFPGYQYSRENPDKNFMTRYWSKEERQEEELQNKLIFLNILRNRIAHHEHIFKTRTREAKKIHPLEDCFSNLVRNYEHILEIFRWLSPTQCDEYEKSSHHFYACYLMSLKGFENDVFDERQNVTFESLIDYLLDCMEGDELKTNEIIHVINQKNTPIGLLLPKLTKPI